MKKITSTKLILLFTISGVMFSCHRKQIGYFNNHSPSYAKQRNIDNENKSSTTEKITSATKATDATIASKSNKINKTTTNTTIEASKTIQSTEKLNESKPLKLKKEARKQIKEAIKKQNDSGLSKVILVIIAIILPPLAVAITDGLSGPFWLSILLWLLFYVPGLIYALWRIFKN